MYFTYLYLNSVNSYIFRSPFKILAKCKNEAPFQKILKNTIIVIKISEICSFYDV